MSVEPPMPKDCGDFKSPMCIDLHGLAALVTGGSRGIGKAVALALAECGADVAIVFNTSRGAADNVRASIEALGRRSLAIECDAANPDGAERAVADTIESFGGLDILVNNVAVSENIPFLALTRKSWENAVSINLGSLFNFTQPALIHMREKKYGRVLNIGSVCGVRPIAAVPVHYAATKGAMQAFTYTLAKEVARYGITINSLAPGLISTDLAVGLPKARQEDFRRFCPMGRQGTPEEVARMAAFMVSNLNSYMTGETVIVSGGL